MSSKKKKTQAMNKSKKKAAKTATVGRSKTKTVKHLNRTKSTRSIPNPVGVIEPHPAVKVNNLPYELFNVITHSIGIGLSVAGLTALLFLSHKTQDLTMTVSIFVYGITMIILYAASVLYHSTFDPVRKLKLKRFDHIAIFIFIAGSYTPFLAKWFRDTVGYSMLAAVWGAAGAGIIMKVMNIRLKNFLNALPYLVMGWMLLFIIKPSVERVPLGCLYLYLGGGIAYSAGVYFYVRNEKYNHGIWHLFVLLGSILHFAGILNYAV